MLFRHNVVRWITHTLEAGAETLQRTSAVAFLDAFKVWERGKTNNRIS